MKVKGNLVHSNVVSRFPTPMCYQHHIHTELSEQSFELSSSAQDLVYLRAARSKDKSDEDDEEDKDGDDCHEDPNQGSDLQIKRSETSSQASTVDAIAETIHGSLTEGFK